VHVLTKTSLVRQRTGDGQPLVLLHGVGESGVGWRPVQEMLSREYDVIALDLPGFGASPALPAGVEPTASALADAVEQELDDLGVADFHVAGYSLGGRIALELASRGRVRSVVAIAPDGLGTPPERIHQAMALMNGRALATVLSPIAAPLTATGVGRSLFFAMERSRPWRLSADDANHLLVNFAKSPGYPDTVRASMFDTPRGLERITCPVLLLQGTADPLLSGQSPRFLAAIPQARMRWLPGLSHVPISDDPALVGRLIRQFVDDAERARRHGAH
jgi:pimeloyl-ACP methyl ester carboxylesterase